MQRRCSVQQCGKLQICGDISYNTFDYYTKNTLYYYKERKETTIEYTKKIKNELITNTWHPDRFMNWCLSVDELSEIEQYW